MSGKKVKLLRKYVKEHSQRHWVEYVKALQEWPFKQRWKFCWFIIKGKKREKSWIRRLYDGIFNRSQDK